MDVLVFRRLARYTAVAPQYVAGPHFFFSRGSDRRRAARGMCCRFQHVSQVVARESSRFAGVDRYISWRRCPNGRLFGDQLDTIRAFVRTRIAGCTGAQVRLCPAANFRLTTRHARPCAVAGANASKDIKRSSVYKISSPECVCRHRVLAFFFDRLRRVRYLPTARVLALHGPSSGDGAFGNGIASAIAPLARCTRR